MDSAGETPKQPQPAPPLVAGNTKWMEFLSEATKFTVMAAFILYSIGFIIWHAYLAKYGTVPVEFLRADYFSAALCYVAMVITFGFPVLMLYEKYNRWLKKLPKTNTAAVEIIAFSWYAMATECMNMFLPSHSNDISLDYTTLKFTVAVCVIVISLIILFAWTGIRIERGKNTIIFGKVDTIALNKLLNLSTIIPLGFLCIGLIATFTNDRLSNPFILSVMVLPLMLDAIFDTNVMKQSKALYSKLIMGTYASLLVIINIQIFGATQFQHISKAIGGGKPEVAYIQISPDHYHLIQSLDLPTTNCAPSTNVLVGPISILLRSEKELVFVNAADLNAPDTITNLIATNRFETIKKPLTNAAYLTITNLVPYTITNVVKNQVKVNAKQIRTDLIDAIRFSP